MADKARPMRADAARNRARVLQVAYDTFAAEGLSVPIDEIARRAGVGAGTVYRHFPTKESLFQAIVADRVRRLCDRAAELAAAADPGEAFFAFLAEMIEEGARDQGLVEALAGIGFDIAEAEPDAEQRFMDALRTLLVRAQQASAVRADVDVKDVKTLLVGCQAMQRYGGEDHLSRRVLAVVRDGLTSA